VREDIWTGAYNSVVQYARQTHADEIDKAYEYFWEEEYPEDFLSGRALELGFVNFEDWLVCDYRPADGKGLIDRYVEEQRPGPEAVRVLEAMRDSVISLYEVVAGNGAATLRDIALGEDVPIKDERLSGLLPGKVFAARIIDLGGEHVLGRCVYPFADRKEAVLKALDSQFQRYLKNKDPEGDMARFIAEESYMFNTIWVSTLNL
jgi:hypothetical protein